MMHRRIVRRALRRGVRRQAYRGRRTGGIFSIFILCRLLRRFFR